MNGEIEVLKSEAIAYPLKFEKQETIENKIVEETIVAKTIKVASADKENRFVRLKRHLRRRSASIL